MDIYPGPTRPTPPEGYAVLAISVAILLIVLGVVGLVVPFWAENPSAEVVGKLTTLSLGSIGLGAAIIVGCRLVSRFTG